MCDDGRCIECGATEEIQRAHVIPETLGGTATVPLCATCHARQHGVDPETWQSLSGLLKLAHARRRLEGRRPRGRRDPETVDLIRDLRRRGLTLREVADHLQASDVPTPSGRGRWHASMVSRYVRPDPFFPRPHVPPWEGLSPPACRGRTQVADRVA